MRININVALLLLAPLGFGQGVMQLSLKRAVEISLAPEGSARVQLAQESIKLADAHVKQSKRAFLPLIESSLLARNQTVNLATFGLSFNFPTIPGLAFSFPTFVGPFTVVDARATAQVPVIDFALIARLKVSRAGLDGARKDLEATRNQVSDRVARAYITALRADAALEANRANVELSQALVDLANSQKTAGTGTGIEVTRAQVQLANNRQKMIVAENDRRHAILELLRGMGVSLDTPVAFTDRLVFQQMNVDKAEEAFTKARAARAELRSQKQREETARLSYQSVKAESLPSIAAFGDYGAIGREFTDARATRTIGVTLKVPIFDGRRNGRREDSLLQYQSEKIRTADLDQQIELEVRLAIDSLRSAESQVSTATEGLTLAENELEQARRRYQAGVTNSIEVTDAQTRLDRARDNRIAALYNHTLARLDLATATGTISEYVNQ